MAEFASGLTMLGHEVSVLTGFPNYPSGKIYPGYRVRPYQRETMNGVRVDRVPLYPEHSRSAFLRMVNYLSFAASAMTIGLLRAPKPDAIFVYHPPLTIGLPAYVLSRFWRIPFVLQIQDLWPETLAATGMLNNQRLLGIVGWFANWLYAKAALIAVISDGFKHNLISKGVPAEKIQVVSNWVDEEKYHPVAPSPVLAERLNLSKRFNVMFAGNMGEAQGLETVLKAAERLRGMPEICFVLVGDGVSLPRLQKISAEKQLTNIIFPGRFPAEDMADLYAIADVLLVHLRDDPLFRITIPHKIFAYLASGKPIIAGLSGDGADLIVRAGAGLACQPDDPEALAATVMDYYRMPPNERASMGERGRQIIQTEFNRMRLIGELAAILDSTVSCPDHPPRACYERETNEQI